MTGITIGTSVLYSILVVESYMPKHQKVESSTKIGARKEEWTLFDKMKHRFGKDKPFTVIWLGITCFDLFIANWLTNDFYNNYVQTRESTLFHYTCLFVTMIFGPCGFLMYNIATNKFLVPK